MARRGAELREHIIDTAKWAFLESGFERTSMDAIATRASTSKRSLYAHFPTKEALFMAIVERSQELFEDSLRSPGHYCADDPAEAAALFCARFLQLLDWPPILRTCRLGISEAEHLPEAAVQLHQVFIGTVTDGLTDHLAAAYRLDRAAAADLATRLLGVTVYPAVFRGLFGGTPSDRRGSAPTEATLAEDVDLPAVREAVRALLP
ncbi:TetR/AcrR family transcriptional regulator [Phaeacidiphilus oryzae]|jgi:AcrR family transcriptional regulator|uniref:TetR/AcrR family transcriptional regulator n=1 Tax=Phaeacidiphilus oryzae TaxID=348818 RepID=UPI00055DA813|nr:TetR/AcrR family transcriptional regulator [Phaeacidiphilus oryzae]